jgi:hypothetical protein
MFADYFLNKLTDYDDLMNLLLLQLNAKQQQQLVQLKDYHLNQNLPIQHLLPLEVETLELIYQLQLKD